MPDGDGFDPRRCVRLDHANPVHKRVVLVDWTLGTTCNYACSYCPPALHDGSISWQKGEAIDDMLDLIRRHYSEGLGREPWIQFTGGEPTVHPDIIEILQKSRGAGFKTSLISNGSRTIRFWRKISEYLDAVVLTYHHESADEDHFNELLDLLTGRMEIHVNVTLPPDIFDAVDAIAERFIGSHPKVNVVRKPLRRNFGSELYEYSDEQLAKFENPAKVGRNQQTELNKPRSIMRMQRMDGTVEFVAANTPIVRNENDWRGYVCEAGLESLRIRADGSVFRAVCGSGGCLGKLGQPVYLPLESTICDRERCSCVADVLISKRMSLQGGSGT